MRNATRRWTNSACGMSRGHGTDESGAAGYRTRFPRTNSPVDSGESRHSRAQSSTTVSVLGSLKPFGPCCSASRSGCGWRSRAPSAGAAHQPDQQVGRTHRRQCGDPDFRSARRPAGRAGALATARAMATRCCSPPDRAPGRWSFRVESPTMPRSCSARVSASPRPSPLSICGIMTFSSAENSGRRRWN